MDERYEPIAQQMWHGRLHVTYMNEVQTRLTGSPFNMIAATQVMRSTLQSYAIHGRVTGHSLENRYLNFGCVEFVREADERHLLLKAYSAHRFVDSAQEAFDLPGLNAGVRPLEVLLYTLHPDGFEFHGIDAERRRVGRSEQLVRLETNPRWIGRWYASDADGDGEPFDQGAVDDFDDLSDDIGFAAGD